MSKTSFRLPWVNLFYTQHLIELIYNFYLFLSWSWAGNGDDECGNISYLDISKQWHAHDYTVWGNELLFSSGIGIKDTSKLATIF